MSTDSAPRGALTSRAVRSHTTPGAVTTTPCSRCGAALSVTSIRWGTWCAPCRSAHHEAVRARHARLRQSIPLRSTT